MADRGAAEVVGEVKRNYRWNYTVNLLEGASFWFGLSFFSSTTIVPLFIGKLTSNPFAVGLAAIIAQASWFLPQLFVAHFVERLPHKKPFLIKLGFFLVRLPMWLLVAAALVAGWSPALALALFLIGYSWHGLGAGITAPAWQELIARCFPVRRRGGFLGTTLFVGAGLGALGAGISSWLLASFPFPLNFAYSFACAASAIMLSWGFLALVREPVQPATSHTASRQDYRGELARIVTTDTNLRHFLTARMLLALAEMGTNFVAVAAIQRWQASDSLIGLYTLMLLIGQTAGNVIFGFLSDKYGHKWSLELGALIGLVAFGLAWLAPALDWYLIVFALIGLQRGAMIVSGILLVLELSAPEKRSTYASLANTLTGCAGVVAPLIGAGLAGASFSLLFALSAGIYGLAGLLMRYWVREPRWGAAPLDDPQEIA